MLKSKFLYIGFFGLVVIGLLTAWQFAGKPYRFHGSVLDPPASAADFILTDQNGQPFTLSQQHGKVALVYFGYTHCPDECPLTMTTFARVRAALGDKADSVRFIFITVDPDRDTRDQIRSYLAKFDPTIIGLNGSLDELAPVWKNYGVFVSIPEHNLVFNYSVNHISRIYAIDEKGNLRMTYTIDVDSSILADDVRHLIAGE
jgi:protein SCO1/2